MVRESEDQRLMLVMMMTMAELFTFGSGDCCAGVAGSVCVGHRME